MALLTEVKLTGSVGRNGRNAPVDVAFVQKLLGGFVRQHNGPPMRDDGRMDEMTVAAITNFQRLVVGLPVPDGRIDPNGRTLRALIAHAAPAAASSVMAAGAGAVSVTYASGLDPQCRIVSDYSFQVIRRAVALAGMKAAVITSTIRLPSEQAAIMYRNAAKNLKAQYKLYGANGDVILEVYEANKGKPQSQVVEAMRMKIEELLNQGRFVSRHVTTPARYAALNVIDIGVNSTRAAAGQTFNLAALTKAFRELDRDGYIKTFIDETAKSNTCWHVEIVPNAKPL